MPDVKIIKKLLVFIVVVLAFYVLKILSFIFIPLVSSIFLALLFMPFMRWMNKRRVPKAISVIMASLLMACVILGASKLIGLSSRQVMKSQDEFWQRADDKLQNVLEPVSGMIGINTSHEDNLLDQLMKSKEFSQKIYQNFGNTLGIAQRTVSTLLMILFFLILLLAGSLDVQQLMELLIFGRKSSSVKTFRKIGQSVVKFLGVKTITSLFTGIGFGLTCYFFGVSFPLFWGIIAFVCNYVQMIGSIVVTLVLIIFALVDLDATGTLLVFGLILTGVQVLFGGVLEPIFMGQSFRINTITVLVMLMLWGYIWGVAGLILSIPITVMLRIIFEQFPDTKVIVKIIS